MEAANIQNPSGMQYKAKYAEHLSIQILASVPSNEGKIIFESHWFLLSPSCCHLIGLAQFPTSASWVIWSLVLVATAPGRWISLPNPPSPGPSPDHPCRSLTFFSSDDSFSVLEQRGPPLPPSPTRPSSRWDIVPVVRACMVLLYWLLLQMDSIESNWESNEKNNADPWMWYRCNIPGNVATITLTSTHVKWCRLSISLHDHSWIQSQRDGEQFRGRRRVERKRGKIKFCYKS
jgi:hypothetical protein